MNKAISNQSFNEVSDYHNDNVVHFPGSRYNSTNPPPNREPDAEYTYETAEGRPAYFVQRWGTGDDKAFRIQNFVSYGNLGPGEKPWQSGFGDAGPLLYRLPQLTASSKDAPVWLCEGEKDADTMAGFGEVATTNPNGAKHWREDFSKALAGRRVIIVEDNDDAGRERTKRILRTLRKYAASVSIVRFEDRPEKSDVTDFRDAGGTLEALKARIEAVSDLPEFERDQKGKLYPSQRNVRLALERLGVTVRYDEFQDRLLIDGLEEFGPALDDAALIRMRLMADERFHLAIGKEPFTDIVSDTARRNRFHPVRDYLDGLIWDKVPRLDTWLCVYGNAKDTEYVRAVGAITLIAAVRRVRKPGCKFDEMLILESPQGKNKSTALAVLGIREEWFSDDLPLNVDTQKVIERIAGRWIIEAAELKGMRKGDVEHLKSFLSRRIDRARLAYARLPVEVPRQCVFIGTDNSGLYLRDMTGNRRFWPVKVEEFDLVALRRDVDQLWAEAASREAAGESIRLDETLWTAAAVEQEERRIDDPFVELIRDTLGDRKGKVRSVDVWHALGIQNGQRTSDHSTRIGAAMRQLGWERTKARFVKGGETEWGYTRGKDKRRIVITGPGKAHYAGEQEAEAPF